MTTLVHDGIPATIRTRTAAPTGESRHNLRRAQEMSQVYP